jgi:hypothetical protein
LNAIIACIDATIPLEPEVYVMHATGTLTAEFIHMKLLDLAQLYIKNQYQSNARERIIKILSETGIPSRMLAIETVEYPFELPMQLLQEIGLSNCFDIGHIIGEFSGLVDVYDALE